MVVVVVVVLMMLMLVMLVLLLLLLLLLLTFSSSVPKGLAGGRGRAHDGRRLRLPALHGRHGPGFPRRLGGGREFRRGVR